MAYFHRHSNVSFLATESTGGAWNTAEQHIAPSLGLLVHCVERDRDARRSDGMLIGRLSYDILGTVPIGTVDATVTVVRAGRTVELVHAALHHHGRAYLSLHAWLMKPGDTTALAGTPLAAIPGEDQMPAWDPTKVWPGGYIASTRVRRDQAAPGRARYWVHSTETLLHDEPTSTLARAATLFDIANGMTVRQDPREVAFPNVDLTVHLFTQPRTDYLGFDTRVSFGNQAIGLTQTTLHDGYGPIGSMSQILTIRPVPNAPNAPGDPHLAASSPQPTANAVQ